ncbi:MAG: AbrB family transcriptional regulator [Burkholderiales bacterium]
MTFSRVAGTLLLALAAAWLCERLHLPLPWMIGPLLATALCGVFGLPVQAPTVLRNAGQGVIGVALGLYFTPDVLREIARLAPALVAGIAWALLLGYGFYRLLAAVSDARSRPDRATAFFSAAIGGASEMVVLGERHGGRTDRIAAAHSLRVLIVVVTIPLGLQWAGLKGVDLVLAGPQHFNLGGLTLLGVLCLLGALLLHRMHLPNPWVLGALAVAMALTASGIELSTLPKLASNVAQLFIGASLGSRFTPEFARSAPRWLAAVALGSFAMIALSAAFAWVIAHAAGLHWATVLLGTSPGGIAEMSITAKVMQLGVPVVTAFHVTRYVVVLLATAPIYRWLVGDAA